MLWEFFWFCSQFVCSRWTSRRYNKKGREGRDGIVREVGSPVWPRRGREGEKHNRVGLSWAGWLVGGLVGAALLLSDVVGTKARRARGGMGRGKTARQDAGLA